VASVDLQDGYAAMRSNKLEDGVNIFKRILHTLLVNTVSSESEVEQAKKIIATAREYILAMAIELERRSISTDTPEGPKLEVAHRQLALMAAMKLAFANKNYNSALGFANRMLANGGSAKLLDQVRYPFRDFFCRSSTNKSNYRLRRSRLNASATLRMPSISSSINLPNSISAPPPSLPSSAALLA
jgi:hypothetical protein